MADYRDTIGKKKQRQTGLNVGPISIGGGGGGGGDDGGSDDDDDGGGGFIGGAIDDAQDAVDDATDTVSDTVDDARDTVSDTVDDTTSGIDDALGGIGGGIDDAVDDAQDAVDDATDTVDDTTDNIGDTIGDIGGGIDDAVDDATDATDDAIDDVQDTVDDTVGDVGDTVDDVSDTVGDVTDDAIETPDVGNLVPDIEVPEVGDVIDEASGEVSDAFDDATDIGGDFAEGAGDAFDDATDIADDAFEGAGDTFDDVTEGAGDAFDNVTEGAGDAFDDATDAAGDFTDDAFDFAGGIADDAGETADDFFEGAGDFAGDAFEGATDAAEGVFGGAVDAAQGAAGLGLDVVDAAADTVLFTPFNIGQQFGEAAANQLSNIGGGGIVGNQGDTTTVPGNEGSPNGTPVQWGEPSQATTVTGAVILKQEALNTPDPRVRFFAIGEDKSGDKVAFGANNKAVKINSVDNLGNLPHFDTLQAAKEVVPHRGGRRNERSESNISWESPEQVDQSGAVAILKQTGQNSNGNREVRFFAATQTDQQQKVFLKSATELVRVANIDTLDDAPSFNTRSEAKAVADEYMATLQDGSGNERSTEDSPRNQGGSGSQDSAAASWQNSNRVDEVEGIAIVEQSRQVEGGNTQTRYLAVAPVEGEGVAVIGSGTEAVRVTNPARNDIPSFETEQAAVSAANSFLETDDSEKTVTDETDTGPGGPTAGTGTAGGFLSGLSPRTIGVGALAIGGGLLVAFGGGEGQTSSRNTGSNENNGKMSNMRVRASTDTGSSSR